MNYIQRPSVYNQKVDTIGLRKMSKRKDKKAKKVSKGKKGVLKKNDSKNNRMVKSTRKNKQLKNSVTKTLKSIRSKSLWNLRR